MQGFLIASGVVAGHCLFWAGQAVSLALIAVGLPGTWGMIALALVFALCTGFAKITAWGLLGMCVAAGVGEAIDLLGGMAGARYGGASKWGMAAALAGGLAGAVAGTVLLPAPIIGSLIGAFAGCFLGAFIVEYHRARNAQEAMKAGLGAFLGRVVAILAKVSIGAGMIVWMAWRIYLA